MGAMKDKILQLLARRHQGPTDLDSIGRALRIPKRDGSVLKRTLGLLEQQGRIARIKGDRYIIPSEADLIPGRLQVTRSGRGFLIPDDDSLEEIEIPADCTSTALHEDRVLARKDSTAKAGADARATGTVVRILERRRTQFVGELKRRRRFQFVVPDDPRLHCEILVPTARDLGRPARVGDKVVVELIDWESRQAHAQGEIIEVLGPPTREGVDMLSVIRQYELPLHFPKKVIQEVRRFGKQVKQKDWADRVDCRKHDVVTIDPLDAKDFDDAFSLRKMPGGQWRLWVHIADVSHYVKPGSALDEEARRRGNSSYLVDRVIPMLPEALSNELCSLKPNVDRLTKCVEFTLDRQGKVLRSRCYSAVIHSRRRFTYEEAFSVLEGNPKDELEILLHQAHTLAQKIRKHRFRAGALALDFPENKIYLKEDGRVDQIVQVENDCSHQLIEEFMLLANEAVAKKLRSRRRSTIYRIHEPPDPKRLREYREEVRAHNIPCGNLERPGEPQKLLRRLDQEPAGKALKIGFLKSLMRARYSIAPIGHYGLAKKDYAHFTSPIRRYADLVVHRSLFTRDAFPNLKEVADHISLSERNSDDAERDSRTVKLFAYLQNQLTQGPLETYEGLVIDIRNFGFFVDVESLGLSGLVHLSSLEDEFYSYHRESQSLKGRRSGRRIAVGDTIGVQVTKVDSVKKQIDFCLPPSQPKGRRGRSSRQGPGTARRAKKRRWQKKRS